MNHHHKKTSPGQQKKEKTHLMFMRESRSDISFTASLTLKRSSDLETMRLTDHEWMFFDKMSIYQSVGVLILGFIDNRVSLPSLSEHFDTH